MIRRLRLTGFAEAISWLVLLCIAMPLKYLGDKPQMVKYVGWIHGILFILYIIQLVWVYISKKWPFSLLVKGGIAAFLPFGTLVFDRQLKKWDQ